MKRFVLPLTVTALLLLASLLVFALAGMTISVLTFAFSVFRSMVSPTGTSLSLASVFALHP